MRLLKLAARVTVGIVGAGLMIHVLAAAVILREIAEQTAAETAAEGAAERGHHG